jgi:hypothetical protein
MGRRIKRNAVGGSLAESDRAIAPKLRLAWEGVAVEYAQAVDPVQEWVVNLAIAQDASPQPTMPHGTGNHLHLMFSLSGFQQIQPGTFAAQPLLALPLSYQCPVTDPSILHLVHLLQAELRSPTPLSQTVVASIVQVLTTHVLQQIEGFP